MNDLLKKYDFKFNKSFGQNFIFDTNLLRAIASDADIDKSTQVLEIGTGAGTLTKILGDMAKSVVSYEVDKNLKPVIEENLFGVTNVQVKFGDILEQSINSIEQNFSGEYKMVANLPYYITTPIIFKFLEQSTNLKTMVIMVQKEVAERLCASEGSANYGAITASIKLWGNAKITRIVKRNMFVPAPNVDSAIVRIDYEPNKFNISDISLTKQVIRSAFNMRRKTLANNLKTSFNLSSEQIINILNKANLNEKIRGEALPVNKFVEIANLIYEIKKDSN